MLALIAAALLAQVPALDPMAYVRAHRDADNALVAGKIAETRAGFASSLEMSPRNATVAYALACTEARAGDKDKALDWLKRAAEWNYADASVALWDEDLASVRKEKRFGDALQLMGKQRPNSQSAPRLVRIWDGREGAVTFDVAVQPLGRHVAIGQSDGFVRLLDSQSGTLVRSSPSFESPVWSLDFDPSGERLAVLTWDGKLHLWSINLREDPTTIVAMDPPEDWQRLDSLAGGSVRFDPTGTRVFAASEDRGATLCSANGERIHSWGPVESHSRSPVWSPENHRIAIVSESTVHFANEANGETTESPLETSSPIRSIAFQPGGRLLATGHDDKYLRVWDLSSRTLVLEHLFDEEDVDARRIAGVSFSPDGALVAGGSRHFEIVHVLNIASGAMVMNTKPPSWWESLEWCTEPNEFSWSSDSRRLWFAFLRGGDSARELAMDASAPRSPKFYGRAPRFDASGLAVATCLRSVLALDPGTGVCRWNRVNLGRTGELLKTATGHFTTNLADLDELWVDAGPVDEGLLFPPDDPRPPSSLAACAVLLFDPKRVRAARDGVLILPVAVNL